MTRPETLPPAMAAWWRELMQSNLPVGALEALERCDEIAGCWSAVSELLSPDPDLDRKGLERVALLTQFLAKEQEAAQRRLAETLGAR